MKTILIFVLASCWLPIVNAECRFNETTQAVNYPEGVTAGSAIYQTTVIGILESETVTYSLVESVVNGETTLFEVTNGGLVKLKTDQTLDFETKPSHVLTLTCSSDTTTALVRTGDPTLTLTVTVDNVAPTFEKPTYTTSIADGSTAGTKLDMFVATDPGNTPLKYSIATGGTASVNADFGINVDTGEIKVADGKTLDKNVTDSYTLILNAVDSANPPLTGSTTISVSVTDGTESGASALAASLLALMTWALAYWI